MFWTLIANQGGLIARHQARAVGWTDRQLQRATDRGELEFVLPGVFRHRVTPPSKDQFRRAVSLWLGDAGAIGGLTAGEVWHLDRVPPSERVTVTSLSRRSPHPMVSVTRSRLDPSEVTVHDGVRVTTPGRTLVDLAGILSPLRLESALESALRQQHCTLLDVMDAAHTAGRSKKGRPALLRLLERRGDGPALQHELEVRTARILRSAGLDAPARQHIVVVDGVEWSVDFAWPAARVGVECDGFEHHGRSRAQFDQDRIKLAALASVGWRIVPMTWTEATNRPDRFLARLAAALGNKVALR